MWCIYCEINGLVLEEPCGCGPGRGLDQLSRPSPESATGKTKATHNLQHFDRLHRISIYRQLFVRSFSGLIQIPFVGSCVDPRRATADSTASIQKNALISELREHRQIRLKITSGRLRFVLESVIASALCPRSDLSENNIPSAGSTLTENDIILKQVLWLYRTGLCSIITGVLGRKGHLQGSVLDSAAHKPGLNRTVALCFIWASLRWTQTQTTFYHSF